jgi:hypothetical protein
VYLVGDWCLKLDPVTIGYGVNKWLLDASTQFISLNRPSNVGGTLTYDLAGVAYQPPAGKKLIILGCCFTGDVIKITYNTILDTYGTEIWTQGNATDSVLVVPLWAEIPAGNYVNIHTLGSGEQTQGTVWGIETTV